MERRNDLTHRTGSYLNQVTRPWDNGPTASTIRYNPPRLAAVRARSRAKVGDRNTLDRGFAKKQVPDRREGCLRKTLQLLERRPGLPALPSLDPRKPTRERIDSQACTVPRPTKKLRLHVNAIHVLHRFQDSMRSTTFAIRSGQSNRDSIISLVMCGATKLANCILSWCLPFSFLST